MRGRVVILLILVVVVVGGGVAFLLLGQDGGGDDPEPTATIDLNQPLQELQGTQTAVAADIATRQAEDAAAPTSPPVALGPVVVAVQDLPRGFRLTDDLLFGDPAAVQVVPWPLESIPVNGFEAIEELEGRNLFVRSDIPRETPLLSTNVVPEAQDLVSVGSDAALVLEPGTVAISIPLDIFGVGQVAYGLQYGDSVDIIMSFLFIEVDEVFQTRQPNLISIISRTEDGTIVVSGSLQGRPEPSTLSALGVLVSPTEVQRPRLITQRTIQDAFVVRVGYFPPDGRILGLMTPTAFNSPTPEPVAEGEQQGATAIAPTETPFAPTIITLGMPPQEAVVLTWALDAQIPIALALRSATESGNVDTTAVTLQYMIENYNIPPPSLLPFSLEPAIRSLRGSQLDIFDVFELAAGVNLNEAEE